MPRKADHLAADMTEVVRRYEAGESAETIGQDYGVVNTTILRYLRERGVAVRSTRKSPTASEVREMRGATSAANTLGPSPTSRAGADQRSFEFYGRLASNYAQRIGH